MKPTLPKKIRVERGEILKEMREIDARRYAQEQMAQDSADTTLDEYDQTLAESFPSSDPPQPK